MIGIIRARIEAVTGLTADRVTGEGAHPRPRRPPVRLRRVHRHAPALAASTPPGGPQLFAPVTAEDTQNNCCGNLLTVLGLEILDLEQAERMRVARTWMHRSGPAALGLTMTGVSSQ